DDFYRRLIVVIGKQLIDELALTVDRLIIHRNDLVPFFQAGLADRSARRDVGHGEAVGRAAQPQTEVARTDAGSNELAAGHTHVAAGFANCLTSFAGRVAGARSSVPCRLAVFAGRVASARAGVARRLPRALFRFLGRVNLLLGFLARPLAIERGS